MPIFGFLMMVAVGAAVWYWRLKMLSEAGSEIIDSVERMRGAFKRRQFRKKAEAAPLAAIQDPAIAAVTFFMCLAAEKPAYKEAAKDLIRQRMKAIIRASDMEEILIFADWTARNVISPNDPIRRFRNLWMTALNADERGKLVSIAEDVAAIGGDMTIEQENSLQALKRALLTQS
jgi:hypothetical protein